MLADSYKLDAMNFLVKKGACMAIYLPFGTKFSSGAI